MTVLLKTHIRTALTLSVAVFFTVAELCARTPVPMDSVRLLPSRFRDNYERDSAWVMSIGVDRLLHSFRTSAGVWAGKEGGYMTVRKLGGWESLDCELRGHTTGHILSALAYMYASTGYECFKTKSDSLLTGLRQVQEAYGNGYLSAWPEGLIDRNLRGEKVWAPWYTLHKITAGLLDQYEYCHNPLALTIVSDMASWARNKLQGLSEAVRQKMLLNEFGGIGESWWRLYGITGDVKALSLARFFTQESVTEPLKQGIADFGNSHTNTYIPKVLALAREYRITGDESSRRAAEFFWRQMVSGHTFCTGSLSDKEHFFDPATLSEHISGYTGETCCTYNLLKLTEDIYQWTGEEAAVDYYERALVNHILGQQNPADGMVSYFLPLKTGTHRVYSTPFDSFWCCVGSGFESHARYGDFIYAQSGDTLIVNLFIPSEVRWQGLGVRLESSFPYGGDISLSISCDKPTRKVIMVRQPSWSGKSGYRVFKRRWKNGDCIRLSFPMNVRLEHPAPDSSLVAVLRGPVVMARPLGRDGFAGSQPYSSPARYNDYYTYDYNIPAGLGSCNLDTSRLDEELSALSPLFDIHGQRYAVYFKTAKNSSGVKETGIIIPKLSSAYPRMTAIQMPDKGRQSKVDRWVDSPDSLVYRLQMYWDSHATKVYIAGERISHVEGPAAPVPTVRYSSSRSNLSDYRRPPLEQVKPRQDSLGLWMYNTKTQRYEYADPAKTARNVESINCEILKIARDAALMYRCGAPEKYAVLAAKVFDTYMTGLYYRQVPEDILHTHQQTLVGLTSFEVIHEDAVSPAAQCYDLLHDRLADVCADKLPVYEEAFRRWADVIIAGGVPHNNWDLIQARFVVEIASVISDDTAFADTRGRRWYLDEILNHDSIRQWSVGHLIDYGFDKGSGLWKECPGYSVMVLSEFASLCSIVRRTTGIDLEKTYPVLQKAPKAIHQYCFPNGWIAAWGDGYYETMDKKDIRVSRSYGDSLRTPVFYSRDLSWFVARSGNDPEASLMFSVAGSDGNHMHANGISLELYGKGMVLAPDMGKGAGYETNDHNEYYAQFPAHNTVCVDGVSTYATMQSHHGFKLEACSPDSSHRAYDSPVMYGDFSFVEPETQALQRRQVIMVNAAGGGGYYVDIFRSRRSDGADKFHDYFFHGAGQELLLDLPMQTTEELAFAGAHLYAYSYLWNKYEADGTRAFSGRFVMTPDEGYEPKSGAGLEPLPKTGLKTGLKLWFNGAPGRTVFKASAPVANSLTRTAMPYDVSHTPVPTLVVRQRGEAWTHPFIAVYEPFRDGDECLVESVSFSGGPQGNILTIKRKDGLTDVFRTYPDGRIAKD